MKTNENQAENLIKSAERVKSHGEVFTPKRIVNKMLNQPEIMAKVKDLTATFLEPAAGEGAFLVELVKRKLKYAAEQSSTAEEFDIKSLMALSSLYGIELLEDNVEILVMSMYSTFKDNYQTVMKDAFHAKPNQKVLDSAKVIIQANIAQGDALKKTDANGEPIIFSEWKPLGKTKVQRTEYTFESIVNDGKPTGTVHEKQLDLFSVMDSDYFANEPSTKQYVPCKWINLYKKQLK